MHVQGFGLKTSAPVLLQVSNLRLRAGTASMIRRRCRRLESADTIRGVSYGPRELAARCAREQSSHCIGDHGSPAPFGLRGGRRRFLYTSTRFGAGTCSCAATSYPEFKVCLLLNLRTLRLQGGLMHFLRLLRRFLMG